MKKAVLLLLLISAQLTAQIRTNWFFYADREEQLPVKVRGSLDRNQILLFVQGGPGEKAVDFAAVDYPGCKETLEQEVAIAYYDQRGLNMPRQKIKSSEINFEQYSHDLRLICDTLQKKYDAEIILFSHSYGGYYVLHYLATIGGRALCDRAIIMNGSHVTDYSPKKYTYYKPEYLRRVAKDKMDQGEEVNYWRKALIWMNTTDSIYSKETSHQWNAYVDRAFTPAEGFKGSLGHYFKLWFVTRPYGLFSYPRKKSDDLVGDLLWEDMADRDFEELLPKIEKDVLFITGEFDDITTSLMARDAASLIPFARAEIADDAGHRIFFDKPIGSKSASFGFWTRNNPHRYSLGKATPLRSLT